MKTKSKTGLRWGTLRFTGVWVFGYIVAWVVSLFAGFSLMNFTMWSNLEIAPQIFMMLMGFGPTVLQAIVQKWVTQRGLGVSMRGWLRTSLFGGLVSGATLVGLYQFMQANRFAMQGNWDLYALFVAWFVPAALVQAWWLRKRVKNAWLWGAVPVVNAILFMTALQWRLGSSSGIEYVYIALIGLMMGIVSGTVMRHLWTQTPEIAAEKAKSDQSVSTSERLQLPDDASDEDDAWQLAQRDNRLKGSS